MEEKEESSEFIQPHGSCFGSNNLGGFNIDPAITINMPGAIDQV